MAVNSNVSSGGERGGRSGIAAIASDTWMRLQTLRPGAAGTSARATMRVRKALGPDASMIRTSVVGGYLELRGSVPTREAFNRAAEAATRTHGVHGVLNFLDVR